MKTFCSILVSFLFLAACTTPSHGDGASIETLLIDIKKSLIKISSDASADALPQLKSVDLVVNTIVTKNIDGKVNLLVASFGADGSSKATQKIEIKLEPPGEATPQEVSDTSDALATAVLDAIRAVKSVEDHEPPLELNGVKATISFATSKTASGGLKITVLSAEIGAGAGVGEENIHQAVLTFER